MKLYATITSERASKGQGGNEYLDIDIRVGSKDKNFNLANLTVRIGDRDGVEVYGLYDESDRLIASVPTNLSRSKYTKFDDCGCEPGVFACSKHAHKKGEQQKGEVKGGICGTCGDESNSCACNYPF